MSRCLIALVNLPHIMAYAEGGGTGACTQGFVVSEKLIDSLKRLNMAWAANLFGGRLRMNVSGGCGLGISSLLDSCRCLNASLTCFVVQHCLMLGGMETQLAIYPVINTSATA